MVNWKLGGKKTQNETFFRAKYVAELVRCICSMHKALSLNPALHKPGLVEEVKAGGLGLGMLDYAQLETSLCYIRPCYQNKTKQFLKLRARDMALQLRALAPIRIQSRPASTVANHHHLRALLLHDRSTPLHNLDTAKGNII